MTAASTLVLFDIDGTLIRNAGSHHREALAAGIRTVANVQTTLEGVATSGMLDLDLIRLMMLAAGSTEADILRLLPRIAAECQTHYVTNCTTDLSDRVCTGVRTFIDGLQSNGAVLGVVTGNLEQIGWKKLELAHLRRYFSTGAFAGDAATRGDVARIALERAVERGLVIPSSRVSLIGDHFNDIDAARANGFLSVAVATGLTSYDDLLQHKPDILVRDLTELDPAALL